MPGSLDALGRVKGIGEAKLAQFGEAVLQLLAGEVVADDESKPIGLPDAITESRAGEPPAAEPQLSAETALPAEPESSVGHEETPVVPTPHAQPAHYWTWRLLEAGFAIDECAAIRGLSEEVVADHALRAADAGWEVAAEWLLSPRLIARLDQVIGDAEPSRIRPLLAQLPNGTRYEQVLFYLKCRQQSRLRS